VVSRPGEEPKELTYEVRYVKRKAAWKIAHVEETFSPPSNYEHLKELEWLTGEWVDDSEVSDVETLAQWTKNKNFITLSFRVQFEGRPALEGTQVIGWTHRSKYQVVGFRFFGRLRTGSLVEEGTRWTVRNTGVLITGEKPLQSTSTRPLTRTPSHSVQSAAKLTGTAAQYRRDQGRSQANLQ